MMAHGVASKNAGHIMGPRDMTRKKDFSKCSQ